MRHSLLRLLLSGMILTGCWANVPPSDKPEPTTAPAASPDSSRQTSPDESVSIVITPASPKVDGTITLHEFPEAISLSRQVPGAAVAFTARLARDETVTWRLGTDEDAADGWSVLRPHFPLNEAYVITAEVLGDSGEVLQTVTLDSVVALDRNAPHLFDERSAKAGDVVAGMTITSFSMTPFPDMPLSYAGIVEFAGETTVKATYQHFGAETEFLANAICFHVDPEYETRLPRSLGDERATFFCAKNADAIRAHVGPAGSTGHATVLLDHYTFDYRPTETWNRATVVKIDAEPDPNLFDETAVKTGDVVAEWTVTAIEKTGDTYHDFGIIRFSGEARGTGTFYQENAETVCFEPDRSFAGKIPRSLQEPRGTGVCAANSRDVLAKLGNVTNRRGELVISDYRYDKRDSIDSFNQAVFVDYRLLDR